MEVGNKNLNMQKWIFFFISAIPFWPSALYSNYMFLTLADKHIWYYAFLIYLLYIIYACLLTSIWLYSYFFYPEIKLLMLWYIANPAVALGLIGIFYTVFNTVHLIYRYRFMLMYGGDLYFLFACGFDFTWLLP